MNAVEIEEAVSELANAPFDRADFAYQFLAAFGNKETTIKRLRGVSGSGGGSNASGVAGDDEDRAQLAQAGDRLMGEQRFHNAVEKMPKLFDQFMNCELLEMKACAGWKGLPAIYVFYDADGEPCHTGRTRNLHGRVRAHTANSHNSASFAFKSTRHVLNLTATYKPDGSRAHLMSDPVFKAEFDRQRARIGQMKLRYVEIDCPIEQHLFELFAALRLGTSLTEFTTS